MDSPLFLFFFPLFFLACTLTCTSLSNALDVNIAVEVIAFLSVEVRTLIGAALTILAEIIAAIGTLRYQIMPCCSSLNQSG